MLRFKPVLSLLCVAIFTVGASAQTTLIDDFSSYDPADYTTTLILDVDAGSATNTTTASVNASGALEFSTTGYDSIEQIAVIRNGLTINVGEEVQADFTHFGTSNNSRNLGLYVGNAAPIPVTSAVNDPRSGSNYITLYGQSPSPRVFQRGFDATGEYTNESADPVGNVSGTYFIQRLDADTYVTGFLDDGAVDGSGRTIVSTLTVNGANGANDANYVGFYVDVRENGTTGSVDNLRIVSATSAVLKGDVDLDGSVTFLDISPFIQVLSSNGFQLEADCDCDGDVDFLDIQPFIDILAGN